MEIEYNVAEIKAGQVALEAKLNAVIARLENPAPAPLFVAVAARMVGVSTSAIKRWIADGTLRAIRPGGIQKDLIPVRALEALAVSGSAS